MGDDEFALILPERSKREAMELAEAIRAGIEGHLFHNGTAGVGIRITVSAGVSENPLDGSSGSGLLEKAQEAVMRAKRAGKNQVVAG
jgi:diguanylate cyclase (GGDEF)-like protein